MKKQRKITRPEWMSFKWLKENIDAAIIMLIAFIATASIFVGWFSSVDWKKATEEDWNHLYEQAEAIQNQELETVINDKDINVEIKLESEECALILKKGEDNKFTEIIENDKAVPTVAAIIGLPFMVLMSVIAWYVIMFVEVVIISIAVAYWPKKLKQKRGS